MNFELVHFHQYCPHVTHLIQRAAALAILSLTLFILESFRFAPFGTSILEPDLADIEKGRERER